MPSLAVVLGTSSGRAVGPAQGLLSLQGSLLGLREELWDGMMSAVQGKGGPVGIVVYRSFFFFLVLPCLNLSLLGSTFWWYLYKPAHGTLPGPGGPLLSAPNGTVAQELGGDQGGHGRGSDHKLEMHGCGQAETT